MTRARQYNEHRGDINISADLRHQIRALADGNMVDDPLR